jgi:uncharacterized Ntn-hydrolase superfamily protein
MNGERQVATYSIVAFDPATQSWGVAAQSRFLAVGWVLTWAQAEAGAVATQALCNPRYGPLGLTMLERGLTAEEAIAGLIAGDSVRDVRQVGVVDRNGRAAAFTGAECPAWAGQVVGDHFCCQGNILAGEAVVTAMAAAFERCGDHPFPERLVRVLEAGQAAGGDTRGQQSATLLVVRRGGGWGAFDDRAVDLRVDDHQTPIAELARLLGLYREIFGV